MCFAFAVLCVVHSPRTVVAQGSDRIAILTEVGGDVTLARAGSSSFSETPEFGTALFANDRVKTGSSGSA